jgi:hypothetical protein
VPKPGQDQRKGKGATDGKSSALAYVGKLEQLAQEKKQLEKEVREGIDKVSDDIGQFSAAQLAVGAAPQLLAQSREQADAKDFSSAKAILDRARAAIASAALPTVEGRINKAQETINAIERLIVVEADLGEQIAQSRKLLKESDMLGALGLAEGAAKRAVELAKTQLTEVVSISGSLLKDAETEGLDVSKARKALEAARAAIDSADYEAAVEHTIKFQTNLERARKGITGEPEEPPAEVADLVGDQDSTLLVGIITQGLQAVDADLKVLEEIRGLVSHPENLASKAHKALEDGNLTQSRRLTREAHLATTRALRDRLRDVLTAAHDRIKKARRDALNVQEVLQTYNEAVGKVDAYKFKEAYDDALSIDGKINALKEEKVEIERAMSEAVHEIAFLTELGTNEARVQELMDLARHSIERGDFKKARVSIAKGLSTAKTSTQNFINNYINAVRAVMLSARTVGGNISTARPLLITAKKDIDRKEFKEALERVKDSIRTIKNVEPEYVEALQQIMDAHLRFTLAESMGLSVAEMGEHLKNSLQELNQKAFDKAVKLAQKADFEVEIVIEDFKTTSEDLAKARESIEEGKKVGADVSEADFLLTKAMTQMEKNSFEVAQELLVDASAAAEKARSARVGNLLTDAKVVFEEEEKKGIDLADGNRLLGDAETAYGRGDYGSTIDMLNEAFAVMNESSRNQELAKNQLQLAEELLSESKRYAEENPLADDFLSTAHNLLASGEYEQSFDVSRQVIIDVESGLVRYIDLIMEDTKTEISRAEEQGASVSQSRDYYKIARRQLESKEPMKALTLARKASSIARETIAVYTEVVEGRDLLDSYIQWGKHVSRTLKMPEEELEQTRALLNGKKYEEAQKVLSTALESARQVQVTFVKAELESHDHFLRELEAGGVGTSVARNTLNQAHHSLSQMNFEQAYTLSQQAREQGLKNQELYKEIVEKLHKGNERIDIASRLGVDTRPLKELVEKTEKALINQTYTFALDFVDQLLGELPKATQVFINRRFNDVTAALDLAKTGGIVVTAQEGLLGRARDVAERGDLESTVSTLDRLEGELVELHQRQKDARTALDHLAEVLEAAGEIGVDATAPRALEVKAKRAFTDNLFPDVHALVAQAEDVLLKTSSTFIVDYINRVQAMLMRLERAGARVAAVEDRIDEAWGHLDDREFTEAFATARECTLTLTRVEERFPIAMDRLRAVEAEVGRVGFLEVDVDGPAEVLSRATEAISGLDFDSAERHLGDALDELRTALRHAAETQMLELDGLIAATEAEGADLAPAKERIDRARALVDEGEPGAGFLMALSGVEAVARAKREMTDAVEARARAEAVFKDAEELGADMTRAGEIVAEVDDGLRTRRYVEAIAGVRRLELEAGKAKHSHVLGLIGQGDTALIEAEELGLSSRELRAELKAAEAKLESKDFRAASATAKGVIEQAKDLKRRYIVARDRIVEVQSQVYDASGIGTNTARSSDLLGESRAALGEQRLDDALRTAEAAAAELVARLGEMVDYEREALADLRSEAGDQGMVTAPIDASLAQAKQLEEGHDLKGALLRLREGIEEGRELLVKYQVALEALHGAEALLEVMAKLAMDSGVPTGETEKVRRLIKDQSYEGAKAQGDVVSQDMRRILDEHMASRASGLLALFAEARTANIRVADVDERYQVARTRVGSADYLAMEDIIASHEKEALTRMAAFKDAQRRIEEAQALLQDAEGLHVDVSTVHPTMESGREALVGGRYPEAAAKGDAAKAQILALERQFVQKYIKDAEDLIAELKSLGIDVMEANECLETARAALKIEEYPGAHAEALKAITTCQEVKVRYNEAKGLIEQAREAIARAQELGVDTVGPEETLEQAIDSLEFQSYNEAKEFALRSRESAGVLMRDHVVGALASLRADVATATGGGVELAKAQQLLALGQDHVDAEDFFAAQDVIEAGRAHLQQRVALHKRAEQVHSRVLAEVANAQTLGVELAPYRAELETHDKEHKARAYRAVIDGGISLVTRLARDQRSMLDLYIGEVMDILDMHIDRGGRPKEPLETLQMALDHFLTADYTGSYTLATKARGLLEAEGHALEEARNAIQDSRRIVIWAEGVGVAGVEDARSELDRAMGLLEGGRAHDALGTATTAYERTLEAIGASARDTLARAENRAEEVRAHGANPALVVDRVDRGRRSLENEDFGFALLFAHLAIAEARRAEVELDEAREAHRAVKAEVEMARRVLDDPTEAEALLEHVTRCLDQLRVREALRQSRSAMTAIRSTMRSSVSRRVERVEDELAIMGHMGLEHESLGKRLSTSRSSLDRDDFLEATSVAAEVARIARGEMEAAARAALVECDEAVDIVGRVSADAPEVLEGLTQAKQLETSGDHYHAQELAQRTTARAKERADAFLLGKVSSVRSLLDAARSLGVDVADLERTLEKADRKRTQAHFVESKEALDALSDVIDKAQRELVDALVGTCDKLKVISAERHLESKAADGTLAEAHHHLSMRGYAIALETAKRSFDGYAAVFTALVRKTLEDAKNLLINLDVSADLETSSDHYIKAEEALTRHDFITAISHADETMANAREIQVRIIQEILGEADVEIERGRAMGADMTSAREISGRALAELEATNLGEGQSMATRARDEAKALQQTHAKLCISQSRMALESLPFEVEVADLREMVETAARSLEDVDFEAAVDGARTAESSLADRLQSHVRKSIIAAEKEIKRGESVGIDLDGPQELLSDARMHLESQRFLEGEQAAQRCIGLVGELVAKHKEAASALGELMELVERATRARARLSEAMDMQEAADDAMEEHDYARVLELAAMAMTDAKRAFENRVKEAISTAEGKLSYLESIGAPAKLAEDLLTMAREALEGSELDGAYDYADQAIKEAEAAKTSFRDIIDISYKAESLIETAKQFGMDTAEAQAKLGEAMETRKEDVNRALALAQESKSIATALVESFYPDLSLAVELESALVQGRWTNANLEIRNSGSARALRIKTAITGNLDIDGLGDINMLRGGGTIKKLPIRVKPTKSGEIMARVNIRCEREYDDRAFEFHDVRWLLAEEPEEGTPENAPPGPQFIRKELTCTICQGTVGTQEAPRACSCGATFHQACAKQLEKCPNCGKSLGGA